MLSCRKMSRPSRPRAAIARQARRRRAASSCFEKCSAMWPPQVLAASSAKEHALAPSTTVVTPMRNELTAAMVGSTSRTRLFQMRTVSVWTSTPDRKSGISSSSNEVRKAKSAADRTPGRMSGSVMRRSAVSAARAQAQRRLLEADVEALERGGHDDDDHGQRQHGVAEGHGQDAAGGLDPHEEEVEADGGDDGRHDHGRQQDRVDRALAAKAAAHQRQRRQEPEHGREDHGQEGDLRADPDGLPPARRAEEALVPAERQEGRREAQIVGAAERDDDDDHHRARSGRAAPRRQRHDGHDAGPRPLSVFGHHARGRSSPAPRRCARGGRCGCSPRSRPASARAGRPPARRRTTS